MNKNKLLVCLSLAAAFGVATVASAAQNTNGANQSVAVQSTQIYTHKESGIIFEAPSGWKTEPDGEQLTAGGDDGAIGDGLNR